MSKEVIWEFPGAVYFKSFCSQQLFKLFVFVVFSFYVTVMLLSVVLGSFSAVVFAVMRPTYLAVLASFGV